MSRMMHLLVASCLICSYLVSTGHGGEKPAGTKTVKAMIDKDGVQRVDVLGGSYFFTPSHIIVKVNTPVELKITKESGVAPHNIAMKAPEAGIDFEESMETEPKSIRFTPTKPGNYLYYCTKKLPLMPSHREKGMQGVLEVIE